MPIRGPLATLLAVAAAGAAVVATNVVLTAGPSDVEQPTAALSSQATAYAPSGSGTSQEAAAPTRYDGRAAGDEVTVQITVENGQARAYICNADKDIEAWVHGTVADGRMQLTGEDGSSVEATSDGTAVFGTARAGGRSWPFSAAVSTDAAQPGSPSGAAPSATSEPSGPASGGGY